MKQTPLAAEIGGSTAGPVWRWVRAIWTCACLTALAIALVAFGRAGNEDIDLLLAWVMLALSFPAGVLCALFYGVVLFVLSSFLEIQIGSGRTAMVVTWFGLFATGYAQWFYLVPYLWTRWADVAAHLLGQWMYRVLETTASLIGKESYRHDTSVVRRASALYWASRSLARKGQPVTAFDTAVRAFDTLRESEPSITFVEMGAMIVALLDRLATETGRTEEVRPKLEKALVVFREVRGDSGTSRELDKVIAWLEYKLRDDA